MKPDAMTAWREQPVEFLEDITDDLHELIVAVIELRAALVLLAGAARARAFKSWGRVS